MKLSPLTRHLGVRGKIQILLFGVILSVGIASVHHARREIAQTLGNELDRRGMAIAEDLAAGTTDPMLTGDLIELNRWVKRAVAHNRDVRYVLLQGPKGDLLLSTFGDRLPVHLLGAHGPGALTKSREMRIQTEEGEIRDFAAPILGGQAGTVRVGMSDRSLRAAVGRHSKILAILVTLAAAFGLMASYWLASYITEPLTHLASAVRSAGMGNLGREVEPQGNDEVGRLTLAFNATTRALAEKEQARQALLEKVITSQEDERKRLARDLHDEVVQLLTSAQLTLDALSRRCCLAAEAPDCLSLAKQVVAKALSETRRLIHDLRPTILDDLGLVPAIRQHAQSRLTAKACTVDVQAEGLPERLDPLVETNVFRIVQEACTNASKYAAAKTVRISLELSGGCLVGAVVDDGAGFQVSQALDLSARPAAGLGIQGMRERANLLGGNLTVGSEPGCGTRVAFSIPLTPDGGELHDHGQDPAVAG